MVLEASTAGLLAGVQFTGGNSFPGSRLLSTLPGVSPTQTTERSYEEELAPQLQAFWSTLIYERPGYTEDGRSLATQEPVTVLCLGTRAAIENLATQMVSGHGTAQLISPRADSEPEEAAHVQVIRWIKKATNLPWNRVADLIGLSRQSVDKWLGGMPIASTKRERLFAVYDILQHAAATRGTTDKLVKWLYAEHDVDGRTPAEMLRKGDIDRARLLAMTTPSRGILAPPKWVRRAGPSGKAVWQENLLAESLLATTEDEDAKPSKDESLHWRGKAKLKRR